jgi:DNA-binding transcriptional MocR family regulator
MLAHFLTQRNIEFIAPSHGLFLFARLAKQARNSAEEKRVFDRLAGNGGVLVGHGRFYKGVEGQFGWARIRFSVHVDVMQDALERMENTLG